MNSTKELRRALATNGIDFECGYRTEQGTVSFESATGVNVNGRRIDIEGFDELAVFGLSVSQIVRSLMWAKSSACDIDMDGIRHVRVIDGDRVAVIGRDELLGLAFGGK